MSKEGKVRACFVIAPIGADGSADRLRSDQVLKHIVGPSVRECGYEPIRADQISEPGLITSQVIQHIVEDPLVVADLTGRNPNVFYELALRHAIKRPIVQIIHATETIPFDVAASRTVHVDHRDLDSVARAREEIIKQIKHVETHPEDVDTPISVAMELQSLRKSDNPLEKSYAEILSMLADIRSGMADMLGGVRGRFMFGPVMEDLMISFERINRVMEFEDSKPLTPEQVDVLRSAVRRLERPIQHLCMESGIQPEFLMRKAHSRRSKE